MTQYSWPLMESAIGDEERTALINFIQSSDRFTNGPEVRKFEEQWAEWQGCKFALFVNSGSSANMLMLSLLKPGSTVATPACTWATNISSMYQLGLTPIFYDIDLDTYSPTKESLERLKELQPDAMFVTHLMGLANNMDEIQSHVGNAMIFEDCCESHGATFRGKKVGNFGIASSFSFYFGHHMTTIEGGMLCTNDEALYQKMRACRSHGMSREMDSYWAQQYETQHPDIDRRFLFITPGFNFRNTEIGAVLGQVQLPKLNSFIEQRKQNYEAFCDLLSQYPQHFTVPSVVGNSSMTLPFHCRDGEVRDELKTYLESQSIETRPFLVGNLMEQPFVRDHSGDNIVLPLPTTERIHRSSMYIGNSQFVTNDHLETLAKCLSHLFG